MRLDKDLSQDPFRVDQTRCFLLGQKLKGLKFPREEAPWSNLPKGQQFLFKILFISICHQFNWDFLQENLFRAFSKNIENLEPWAKNFSSKEIESILTKYPKQERVRAQERSKIIRTTAKKLYDNEYFISLIRKHNPKVCLNGASGFYNQLQKIPAFRADPLMKKSAVLVHDLFREEICIISDPEEMIPAVDYHIQRSYIRTGRVFTDKRSVIEALKDRTDRRVRLVQLFRKNVSEAMSLTSFYSGLSIADLNYAEWQISRNICTKNKPFCSARLLGDLPSEFYDIEEKKCPFYGSCRSIDDANYEKMLLHPAYSKNFF